MPIKVTNVVSFSFYQAEKTWQTAAAGHCLHHIVLNGGVCSSFRTHTDGRLLLCSRGIEIIAPKITPKHWLALTGLLLRAQKIQFFRRIVISWQAMSIILMRIVVAIAKCSEYKLFPNAMLHHQHCLFFR